MPSLSSISNDGATATKEKDSEITITQDPTQDFPILYDVSSSPSTFKKQWLATAHHDPSALPFPKDDPPFQLNAIDWHQLTLKDDEFPLHTWTELSSLIAANKLDELKRVPSFLKAYLAWCMHVKSKYGGVTQYILQQRLGWRPLDGSGALVFKTASDVPFADDRDYKILRNDWSYGMEAGVVHLVVWLKPRLPVDGIGALTEEGKVVVEAWIDKKFRRVIGEEIRGEKVLWFRNPTGLQSVRSLEHVHVLVRGVGEEGLGRWVK